MSNQAQKKIFYPSKNIKASVSYNYIPTKSNKWTAGWFPLIIQVTPDVSYVLNHNWQCMANHHARLPYMNTIKLNVEQKIPYMSPMKDALAYRSILLYEEWTYIMDIGNEEEMFAGI